MTEPALSGQQQWREPTRVVQPDTGELLEFNGTTVPMGSYRDLEARHVEASDKLEATLKALSQSHRHAKTLQKEIDDLLDQAADRDTVRKCLEFWRDKTGRSHKTRIDLASGRARHVRWALRHWTPREFCEMVVGMVHDEWYQQHPDATDVKHLLQSKGVYDEAKAEKFLLAGRTVLGAKA